MFRRWLVLGLFPFLMALDATPVRSTPSDAPVLADTSGYKRIDGLWHLASATRKGELMIVPDRAIVELRPGVSAAETEVALNQGPLQGAGQFGAYQLLKCAPEFAVVTFPEGSDAFEVRGQLRATGLFEHVSPDITPRLDFPPPDDPLYGTDTQWNLYRIQAPDAWAITTGSATIRVGVLDSKGVDEHHATQNDGDLFGSGHYNATIDRDFSVQPPDNYPWAEHAAQQHGTACIGILGAVTNNGRGVAGIAGGDGSAGTGVTITMYKTGTIAANAAAIEYATDQGVRVLSCSWSFPASDYRNDPDSFSPLDAAIEHAVNDHDAVLVFSAGNADIRDVAYPALHPLTAAVGATNRDDVRCTSTPSRNHDWFDSTSPGSNWGPMLDVMGPSDGHIYTTDLWGLWGYNGDTKAAVEYNPAIGLEYTSIFSGTSAAAPQVAGVAALVLSVAPTLNPAEARSILCSAADKVGGYAYTEEGHLGPGFDDEMSYGRLNAYKAVLAAQTGTAHVTANITWYSASTPIYGSLVVDNGVTMTLAEGASLNFLAGTLTVSSGATLVLEEDATLSFYQVVGNYRLIVNGGGTVDGAGAASSTIEGRVEVTGTNATVRDLRIHWPDEYGMGYGIIEMSGSMIGTQVLNCGIDGYPNENNHYGVRCTNTGSYWPVIRGNTFKNVYAGVYAYNGSDPVLYRAGWGDDCGGPRTNTFENSAIYGLYAYMDSEFQAGDDGDYQVGANNFERASALSGYHVYAVSAGIQELEWNYWNGGPDVYPTYMIPAMTCGAFSKPGRIATDEVPPLFAAIHDAVASLAAGDTTTALNSLKSLAENQADALDALFVLDKITEIARPEDAGIAVRALRGTQSHPAVQQATAWVLARLVHWNGDRLDAADWYAKARDVSASASLATESKFAEAELLVDIPDHQSRVKTLLERFLAEAAEDNPNRKLAQGWVRGIEVSPEPKPVRTLPEGVELTVRPNPFNPLTTIDYRVDAPGPVGLAVFTVAGQLVRELVSANDQAPGVYTAVWDGNDASGRPVASGVYLVRLVRSANPQDSQTNSNAVRVRRVTLVR